MAGDRDRVKNSAAQLNRHRLKRPVCEPEELLDIDRPRGDDGRIQLGRELKVAGNVVAVAVGVTDHERKHLAVPRPGAS